MQGAEPVNFDEERPVETLKRLTNGAGPDRVIDAVGVDAKRPHRGPAAVEGEQERCFEQERAELAPGARPQDGTWQPGDAPSQVLQWAVEAVAKAGTVAIVGVYPPTMSTFPVGTAMNKDLTVNMGNCHHRR